MRLKTFLIQLVIAAATFASAIICAASPDQQYVFAPADLNDELSQGTAIQIYQDSIGFIWVLTQEGLNRFDGRENLVFRADVNIDGSLSNDNLRRIAEDADGNLWLATSEEGLNRFIRESQSFEVIRKTTDASRGPLSNRIRTLSTGLNDKIWIGYEEGGFSILHPRTRIFKHYTSQRWSEIPSSPVTSIFEERSGLVWVATNGDGVLLLDRNSEIISKVGGVNSSYMPLTSEKVRVVFRDSKANMWVGTEDGGVTILSPDLKPSVIRYTHNRVKGEKVELKGVYDIYEDADGQVFLATRSGISLYEEGSSQLVQLQIRGQSAASSPSTLRIYSIIQDRSGRYWAGGFTGVYGGYRSNFATLGFGSGLADDNVLSVTTLEDGSILIGTPAGVRVIQSDAAQPTTEFFYPSSPVMSMLSDQEFVWMGTFDAGLFKVDTSTGRSQQFLPSDGDSGGISDHQITTINQDSFGNLWVGTFGGGLNLLRPGSSRFEHYSHDPRDEYTLSSDTVYAIFQEKNGDLWIGTNNGLNRFNYDIGTFDRFLHDRVRPGSLSSRVVYSIHEDAKARLWIGTQGGGLNMWEPMDRKSSVDKFRYFQSNIGLPSSTIYAIQRDDSDNLWLATSGGLTRFDYEQNTAKNFTVDDGLQSNDFNLGASHRDASGRLFFGGSAGLNVFFPDRVKTNSIPPELALTRVSLSSEQRWFDKPYNELETIELQPDDYMLGFAFAALDFNAPSRNRYRYQMVGLDKNWIDLGNRNTIDFSKLPMGKYVFRAQAANPDGIWSPRGIALDIIVHPPFYLTWYAFLTYIGSALLLVMLLLQRQRQRERVQLQYQAQLEDDVRARTRDLRRSNEKLQVAVEEMGRAREDAVEANQAKSEFLAALSHEIRTPMHGVLGMTDLLLHSGLSERQQNFAESAHTSANELLGLIDNILDFSKIEAGKLELEETTFNLRELTENLCYLYGELAQAKNLEINLVFNADVRRQVYGDPVRLRQILQNLLSNAIKFTSRGSVNLIVNELSRSGKSISVEFLVEDTGIGMNQETIDKVFEAFSQADTSTTRQFGGTGLGLSIAKQLIELMDGKLHVQSRPGMGTTMSVRLALVESPLYTESLSTVVLENFYAEVVAPVPETRAMFRSQLEALHMKVRECAVIEELAPRAEHRRLILIDVTCLYNDACIAEVENLSRDPASVLLLVTPLSGAGIPEQLSHLAHTTKPARTAGLVTDILAAESSEKRGDGGGEMPLLRFDKRILLVEDMAANQEIAKAMLESFGCTVALARNGEVALEMYQQDEFDLVLMDCQMPVMDGFEATRHIRQFETNRSGRGRVPVVALTAGKTESEKERCFACGMDRILFKPYSTTELNSLLEHYFDPCGEVEPPRQESRGSAVGSADLLDAKALDNIRSIEAHGGNSLLLAVFENFKADAQIKLDELRADPQNPRVLSASAHAIKSMSLNIGAKALAEYCRKCEAQWKQGATASAAREIEVMAGHYRDAVRALEQLIVRDEEAV